MSVLIKAALLAGLLVLLSACPGGSGGDSKKLDDVIARLDRIEKKIEGAGALRPRPPMPPPPQEDTKTVYSVPIDGDPIVGPKAAKVTIVEASDFA